MVRGKRIEITQEQVNGATFAYWLTFFIEDYMQDFLIDLDFSDKEILDIAQTLYRNTYKSFISKCI